MTDESMSADERVPGPSGAKSPPPSVDRAAFEAKLAELRVREKAHTREGDAIAAARRRLPMVEMDATLRLIGADGPVTLLDAFEGRRQPQSQRAIWARWLSTRLMASRPLRGLTRRLFFSKAGAIDLPEYASAAAR